MALDCSAQQVVGKGGDPPISRFLFTLGFYLVVMIVLMGIFSVLRLVKISARYFNFQAFYAPRDVLNGGVKADRTLKQKILEVYVWPIRTILYPMDAIIREHSADSAMHLMFSLMCMGLCSVFTIFGFIILIPINVLGGLDDDWSDSDASSALGLRPTGLGVLTMAHVSSDRRYLLLAHAFLTLLYVLLTMLALYGLQRFYVYVRSVWHHTRCARAFTVMADEIPPGLRSAAKLEEFFMLNYNAPIHTIHFAYNDSTLRKLANRRDYFLDHSKAATAADDDRTLRHGRNFLVRLFPVLFGYSFDDLSLPLSDLYRRKLEHYETKLNNIYESLDSFPRTRVAFITFKSMLMPRLHSSPFSNPSAMTLCPAPEPRDVYWRHMTVVGRSRAVRALVTGVLVVLVSIAFSFLIVAATSLFNLWLFGDVHRFDFLDRILAGKSGLLFNFIQGVVPPLLVAASQTIFYKLCALIFYNFLGLHIRSAVDNALLGSFFLFLFLNVFLLTAVGTSLLRLLGLDFQEFSMSCLFALLASAVPEQSGFFMSYILAQACFSLPRHLLRAEDLFEWFWRLWRVSALRSPEADARAMRCNLHLDPPRPIAVDALIFGLVLIYSTYSPLICLFGTLYFGMSFLTHKYNAVHVRMSRYESGADFWPILLHCVMVSVVFFLLFMSALLGLLSDGVGVLLLVLIFVVSPLWFVLSTRWRNVAIYGPVHGARRHPAPDSQEFVNAYLQPSLGPPHTNDDAARFEALGNDYFIGDDDSDYVLRYRNNEGIIDDDDEKHPILQPL